MGSYLTTLNVVRHWHAVAQEHVVFALSVGPKLLIEGPEERTDVDGVYDMYLRKAFEGKKTERPLPPREAVLRLFTEYEDLYLYADLMTSIYGENVTIETMVIPVSALFELKDEIAAEAKQDEADIRFDLCVMRMEDQWPIAVDTLWASNITIN